MLDQCSNSIITLLDWKTLTGLNKHWHCKECVFQHIHLQIHTVHELRIPVNAVSEERIDPLNTQRHTETVKGIHTLSHTHKTLAETYLLTDGH